jgi:hypothetical protein
MGELRRRLRLAAEPLQVVVPGFPSSQASGLDRDDPLRHRIGSAGAAHRP